MSNATHGMNLEEVEDLGRFLKGKGASLKQIMAELDSQVRKPDWQGSDADRFRNDWWPKHKAQLRRAAETIDGLGQAALNNAKEQRSASEDGRTTASPAVGPPQPGPAGVVEPEASVRTETGPGWGHQRSREDARSLVDKYVPKGKDYAPYNARSDDWYQCTTWVKARWIEKGYTGPMWSGDGGNVATNINAMLNQRPGTGPTVGAIVSDSRMGHVAVVEEVQVRPDGTYFRVSEMNMGGNGADEAGWEEYRDGRWVKHVPGDPNYTYANFPG